MPSFGVIANRLGQIGQGFLAGREQRTKDDREEYLTALKTAAALGPAGINPSPFMDGAFSKGNPHAGKFADVSAVFLRPYEQKLAADQAKLQAEQEDNELDRQLRRDLAELSANTQRTVAGLYANRRRGAGGFDDLTFNEFEDLKGLVQAEIDTLLPDDAFDSKGGLKADYGSIYNDIERDVLNHLQATGAADPVTVRRATREYFESRGYQVNAPASSWYLPWTWGADPTVKSRPDLHQVLSAARSKIAAAPDAERAGLVDEFAQAIAAEYGHVSADAIRKRLGR